MHVESLVFSNYNKKQVDLLFIIFIKSPFLPLHLFLLPSRWPPAQWRPSCAWSADRNKKKHSGLTLYPGDNEFSSCCEKTVTPVRNAFIHLANTRPKHTHMVEFYILRSYFLVTFPSQRCAQTMAYSLPIPHGHMCSSCDRLENDPPCLTHKFYKTLSSKWFLILP